MPTSSCPVGEREELPDGDPNQVLSRGPEFALRDSPGGLPRIISGETMPS